MPPRPPPRSQRAEVWLPQCNHPQIAGRNGSLLGAPFPRNNCLTFSYSLNCLSVYNGRPQEITTSTPPPFPLPDGLRSRTPHGLVLRASGQRTSPPPTGNSPAPPLLLLLFSCSSAERSSFLSLSHLSCHRHCSSSSPVPPCLPLLPRPLPLRSLLLLRRFLGGRRSRRFSVGQCETVCKNASALNKIPPRRPPGRSCRG